MKNLVVIVIGLVTLSLTSCKKNYVCACNKTRTSGGTTVITDDGKYTFDDTRPRAVSRCNAEESTGSDAFGNYSRDCSIQ